VCHLAQQLGAQVGREALPYLAAQRIAVAAESMPIRAHRPQNEGSTVVCSSIPPAFRSSRSRRSAASGASTMPAYRRRPHPARPPIGAFSSGRVPILQVLARQDIGHPSDLR